VTEKGRFWAHSELAKLGALLLERRQEKLARITRVSVAQPTIVFLTEPGPSGFIDGAEFGSGMVLALASDDTSHVTRTTGPSRWSAVALASEDIRATLQSSLGASGIWTKGSSIIVPPPDRLARLRALHRSAFTLATTHAAESIAPAREAELQDALFGALVSCLERPIEVPKTLAEQRHRLIVRRFQELLEDFPATNLYMPEICQTLGVPGRTLRMACQNQLGLSPNRYQHLRRLHLARRILQRENPEATTVTAIATSLGFWELGRFSVLYRDMFGETPSMTLTNGHPGAIPRPPLLYGFA